VVDAIAVCDGVGDEVTVGDAELVAESVWEGVVVDVGDTVSVGVAESVIVGEDVSVAVVEGVTD